MRRTGVPSVAVMIEGGRLSAVMVRGSGAGVVIERWVIAALPAGMDAGDGRAVGAWLGERLREAGMLEGAKKGGVVFAASRGEVTLKRLAFPPGVAEHELPGMVRLQLGRGTGVADDEWGVDYCPLGAGASEGGRAVLASSLGADRMRWRREAADAAGVRIARVGLTVEGSSVMVRARAVGGARGTVLGIVPGAGATELVVVEPGGPAFARAIDVVRALDDPENSAGLAAMVVEAKRTWMSYRVGADSTDVECAVVMGTDAFAKRLAAEIGAALEIPAEAADLPETVTSREVMTPAERAALAPLVGLLGQRAGEGLNLVSPRRFAPAGEGRRRRVLIGALAAVLLAGSAWTWAQRDLSRRRGEVQDLQTQQQQVAQKHAEFVKAKARLEHLRAFLGTRADWTSQLNRINQQLPDPPAAVIEELRASLSADVRFELPKDGGKGYARGKWDPRRSVVFGVAGRVRQRDVADDLRLRLLDEYLVEPRGADVADRFDYQLTQRPPAPAKADAPGTKPATAPKAEPAKAATPEGTAGGNGGGA